MKSKSYKNFLEEINKQNEVILTVSLRTYRNKRMTFKIPFNSIKHCFDWDMVLTGDKNDKVTFSTIKGERHSYWYRTLKTERLDYVEIPNFMDKTNARFRSYKNVLEEVNKKNNVVLTVSLWTYSSGKMTFNVPFDSIKQCFDWDMVLTGDKNGKVTFSTVTGEEHSYLSDKLKIAKLDCVEIPTFRQPVKTL